jgi:receptor protein-tyrosine kinase
MTLQDAVHILRKRWITVVVVSLVASIIAVAYALLTPPSYVASTSIFIATPDASSPQDAYAAAEFASKRTIAYRDLIMSESLTTRTVRRLNLDITPRDLANEIDVSVKPDSVVITLTVTDSSPNLSVSLANELSADFVTVVKELEAPAADGQPGARAVIIQAAETSQQVWPLPQKIISFGVLAGLILGCMVALVRGRPKSEIKAVQRDAPDQVHSPDAVLNGKVPGGRHSSKVTLRDHDPGAGGVDSYPSGPQEAIHDNGVH